MDNKKRAVDSLCRAVHEVRLAVGDTQQQFAGRLNMAISTVVRYELTRPPKGEVLVQFMNLAKANGRPDLAEQFWRALHHELGLGEDAGRKIDNAAVEVGLAAVLARELDEHGEEMTPEMRKDYYSKLRVLLDRAAPTLNELDPYTYLLAARKEAPK